MISAKPPKDKKCPVCREMFTPVQFAQKVCITQNFQCAREWKEMRKQKAEEKRERRRKKKEDVEQPLVESPTPDDNDQLTS